MSDTLLKDLLSALDVMVVERNEDGHFSVIGEPPGWFCWLFPEAAANPSILKLNLTSPFLENFLIDAEHFWKDPSGTQLKSGSWEEKGGIGKEDHLEATALSLGGRSILLIELLGAAHEERRRMLQIAREKALLQHQLLKEIQKKEILLHCLANDLVRLLMGVKASFPLIQQEPLSAAGCEYVSMGERQVALQEKLVNDILHAFAADMDSLGPFKLNLQKVPDAYACAKQVVSEMAGTAALHKVTLQMDYSADPGRDWRVFGETARLQRVMTNLIENALLAGPPFSIVTIGLREEESHVTFSVDDEGTGVSTDLLGTLFHKFAPSETGNVGFGLFFCRIMVERWGGTLGYTPRTPRGSRFWIRLPKFVAI